MIARQVLSVMFVFALIGAVPAVSFADTVSIEELAAGLADTPEDHKAVASYYRGKAEEARAEAQRHRKMGSMYLGGKYRQKDQDFVFFHHVSRSLASSRNSNEPPY